MELIWCSLFCWHNSIEIQLMCTQSWNWSDLHDYEEEEKEENCWSNKQTNGYLFDRLSSLHVNNDFNKNKHIFWWPKWNFCFCNVRMAAARRTHRWNKESSVKIKWSQSLDFQSVERVSHIWMVRMGCTAHNALVATCIYKRWRRNGVKIKQANSSTWWEGNKECMCTSHNSINLNELM